MESANQAADQPVVPTRTAGLAAPRPEASAHPAPPESRRGHWLTVIDAKLTPARRLAILVVAVGIAMVVLRTPVAAMLVVAVGLLTVCAIAQRVENQRRGLHEALLREQHERANADQIVAVERGELASQLEFWATHEPVTGLANRTLFTRAITEAIAGQQQCGVMIVSLAEFSAVTLTHGSAVGDQVLHAIAGRLRHALRPHDVAGRLGGNDFGILLNSMELPHAQATGDRLLRVFDNPVVLADASVELNARAGLAVRAHVDDPADALELIRRAEVAAAASRNGDAVHVFAPALQTAAAERNRLDADLRRSLDSGEFVCHYQPLVSTADGRVTSFEALVRWNHPERGLVLPYEFIAAAERNGLIVPLGIEVLTQACRDLLSWHRTGRTALTVAVNLSARQLSEPGFVDSVKSVVWGSGVDPRHIMLEITESLLVEDSEGAIETLWGLRALGLRLAVDDFGTGYSSLSRLSDMPIDELKIDKSFTDRIHARVSDSAPIISAAVAMGHALGLTVVAEGVETREQADFLRDINCDLLQGYLLSRPVDLDNIGPLLAQASQDVANVFALRSSRPRSQPPDPEPPFVPRILPSVRRSPTRRRIAQ